ncbi:hypothetical protein T492DRAFT_1006348 [Pavlovales sp. CCMP2436]|nr:hypothetical protein T492DRAFT_1006348 [Pavlovales sp. CCMP2436]
MLDVEGSRMTGMRKLTGRPSWMRSVTLPLRFGAIVLMASMSDSMSHHPTVLTPHRAPAARGDVAMSSSSVKLSENAKPVKPSRPLVDYNLKEGHELKWLSQQLPKSTAVKADREDPSLAREVSMGYRAWLESAEGRKGHNTTTLMPSVLASLASRRVGARLDDAQARLLGANMGLVIHLARRYVNKGVSLADLVQEGAMGLLYAMGKYDPNRGIKFVTYAYVWINQHMGRAVANKGATIRLPVYVHEARRRMQSARISDFATHHHDYVHEARRRMHSARMYHCSPSTLKALRKTCEYAPMPSLGAELRLHGIQRLASEGSRRTYSIGLPDMPD